MPNFHNFFSQLTVTSTKILRSTNYLSLVMRKPVTIRSRSDTILSNAETSHRLQTLETETRGTVMIQNLRTNRSEQTVQTQIRLLREEQSDQGLHCLFLTKYLQVWPLCLNFRCTTAKLSGVQKFRNFMVLYYQSSE